MESEDGEIWGNEWQTECIVRIDPAGGAVLGWILLEGLTARAAASGSGSRMDVLNGALAASPTSAFIRSRWASTSISLTGAPTGGWLVSSHAVPKWCGPSGAASRAHHLPVSVAR